MTLNTPDELGAQNNRIAVAHGLAVVAASRIVDDWLGALAEYRTAGRRAFDARLRNEAFHVVAIARASPSFAAVDQMAGSLMLVFLRKASLGGD